jgi:hypothetical protein
MKVPTPPSPTPPPARPEAPPLTGSPSAEELRAALADARVAAALHLALRDVRLKARFASLRAEGLTVDAAVERLRGPHVDASSRPYYLSDERVRGIVYEKS